MMIKQEKQDGCPGLRHEGKVGLLNINILNNYNKYVMKYIPIILHIVLHGTSSLHHKKHRKPQ